MPSIHGHNENLQKESVAHVLRVVRPHSDTYELVKKKKRLPSTIRRNSYLWTQEWPQWTCQTATLLRNAGNSPWDTGMPATSGLDAKRTRHSKAWNLRQRSRTMPKTAKRATNTPNTGQAFHPPTPWDQTLCVYPVHAPSSLSPPHVCHRQRDRAVSVGSHMQQDINISDTPAHLGAVPFA